MAHGASDHGYRCDAGSWASANGATLRHIGRDAGQSQHRLCELLAAALGSFARPALSLVASVAIRGPAELGSTRVSTGTVACRPGVSVRTVLPSRHGLQSLAMKGADLVVRVLRRALRRTANLLSVRGHGRPSGRLRAGAGSAPPGSPFRFFALLFLITVPMYALRLVPPFSLLMVANPLIAASILTYREEGADGVKRLLARPFDYRRIARKRWYLPILLLVPLVTILSYAWMRLAGVAGPALRAPALLLPAYFLVFFVLAIGEEAGWSGYALDPLQDRWRALPAGIVMGTVWALWHLVPYALANPPLWVAGQCATTVLLRVLMVWIYNNTGRSVFGMVVFHAMTNMGSVPDYGFPYDPVRASVILAAITSVVVFLWGPRTLARYRYA